MYVDIRSVGQDQFCQSRLSKQMAAGNSTPSKNDSCNTRNACKLRNLIWDVFAIHGFNISSKLFCQLPVFLQTFFVFFRSNRKIRCFHKQRSKLAVKGICHSCRSSDDFCVGGCGRKASKDVLIRIHSFLFLYVLCHHPHLLFNILSQRISFFHRSDVNNHSR